MTVGSPASGTIVENLRRSVYVASRNQRVTCHHPTPGRTFLCSFAGFPLERRLSIKLAAQESALGHREGGRRAVDEIRIRETTFQFKYVRTASEKKKIQ